MGRAWSKREPLETEVTKFCTDKLMVARCRSTSAKDGETGARGDSAAADHRAEFDTSRAVPSCPWNSTVTWMLRDLLEAASLGLAMG